MKRFTSVCIDNISKLEIVLSECSYNNACMFLESENRDNRFGKFLYAKNKIDDKNKKHEKCKVSYLTTIKYEKACFLHDDIRGLLLRMM